jgi:hypothetical protein
LDHLDVGYLGRFGNICSREEFLYFLSQAIGILRLEQASVNSAIHTVQEFYPIIKFRFSDRFPVVVSLLTIKKTPISANLFGIRLPLSTVLETAFPTDLSLCHISFEVSLPKKPSMSMHDISIKDFLHSLT